MPVELSQIDRWLVSDVVSNISFIVFSLTDTNFVMASDSIVSCF